jgi:hypothetical protein
VRLHFGCGLEPHAFTLQEDRELRNQPFQAGSELGESRRPQANLTRGAVSVLVQNGIAQAPGAGEELDRQRRSSDERGDPRETMVAFTVDGLGLRCARGIGDGQVRVSGSRDSRGGREGQFKKLKRRTIWNDFLQLQPFAFAGRADPRARLFS